MLKHSQNDVLEFSALLIIIVLFTEPLGLEGWHCTPHTQPVNIKIQHIPPHPKRVESVYTGMCDIALLQGGRDSYVNSFFILWPPTMICMVWRNILADAQTSQSQTWLFSPNNNEQLQVEEISISITIFLLSTIMYLDSGKSLVFISEIAIRCQKTCKTEKVCVWIALFQS